MIKYSPSHKRFNVRPNTCVQHQWFTKRLNPHHRNNDSPPHWTYHKTNTHYLTRLTIRQTTYNQMQYSPWEQTPTITPYLPSVHRFDTSKKPYHDIKSSPSHQKHSPSDQRLTMTWNAHHKNKDKITANVYYKNKSSPPGQKLTISRESPTGQRINTYHHTKYSPQQQTHHQTKDSP